MKKEIFTKENIYDQLTNDWDAELNCLHGEELWDTPNNNSRHIRRMVVEECLNMKNKIKRLPLWRRMFNFY